MAESLITQVGRPLLGVLPEDSPASPPPHGDDDGSAGDSIPLGPPSSRKTDTHLRYGRGRGSFQDLSREQKRELAHSRRLRSPAPVSSTTSLPARRRNSAKQMARRRRKANLNFWAQVCCCFFPVSRRKKRTGNRFRKNQKQGQIPLTTRTGRRRVQPLMLEQQHHHLHRSSPSSETESPPIASMAVSPDADSITLLPPQPPQLRGRKTLILDLDETLVHSNFTADPDADFALNIPIQGHQHSVYVRVRPYVQQFLRCVMAWYEVIIFTASLAKYADPLLDRLDFGIGSISFRLFREACVLHEDILVKDLSFLGRPMQQVVIIDNSPLSYMFQPQNALPVTSWFDDRQDDELLRLLPVLEEIARLGPDPRLRPQHHLPDIPSSIRPTGVPAAATGPAASPVLSTDPPAAAEETKEQTEEVEKARALSSPSPPSRAAPSLPEALTPVKFPSAEEFGHDWYRDPTDRRMYRILRRHQRRSPEFRRQFLLGGFDEADEEYHLESTDEEGEDPGSLTTLPHGDARKRSGSPPGSRESSRRSSLRPLGLQASRDLGSSSSTLSELRRDGVGSPGSQESEDEEDLPALITQVRRDSLHQILLRPPGSRRGSQRLGVHQHPSAAVLPSGSRELPPEAVAASDLEVTAELELLRESDLQQLHLNSDPPERPQDGPDEHGEPMEDSPQEAQQEPIGRTVPTELLTTPAGERRSTAVVPDAVLPEIPPVLSPASG